MKCNTFRSITHVCVVTAVLFLALPCFAARHHEAPDPYDLSPILVQPFSVSTEPDPTRKAWDKKMNLEDGVEVRGTRYITASDVTTRDLFILQITQSLEGGFDSTNIYDRGILSWGIMQWATHCRSMDGVLLYIKTRLSTSDSGRLWHKLFVDNGLDVDPQGIILYGKHPASLAERRLDIRGSAQPGEFDPSLVNHWATVLARAGRQPQIQSLQIEYADKIVDGVLDRQVPGLTFHAPARAGITPEDLAGSDPYAEALLFVIWVNNPTNAWQYIADSAKAVHAATKNDDPAQWPSGMFSDVLMRRCKGSHFGNWSARAAMIEARSLIVRSAPPSSITPFEQSYQLVLADRKQLHIVEFASRHMEQQRSSAARGVPLPKASEIAAAPPKQPEAKLKSAPIESLASQSGTFIIPPNSVITMDPTTLPDEPNLNIGPLHHETGTM